MPTSSENDPTLGTMELPEFEYEMATAHFVGDLLDEIHRVLEVEAARVGMTKSKLADRMCRNKSFVTRLLAGNRNLTLQTAARVIRALDHEAHITLKPLYTFVGNNQPTYHEVNGLVLQPPLVTSVHTAREQTVSVLTRSTNSFTTGSTAE